MMAESYCAKVEAGVVTQVIVCGNSDWASQNLGGEWICTGKRLVGIGWLVENGEVVEPHLDEPVEPEDEPA